MEPREALENVNQRGLRGKLKNDEFLKQVGGKWSLLSKLKTKEGFDFLLEKLGGIDVLVDIILDDVEIRMKKLEDSNSKGIYKLNFETDGTPKSIWERRLRAKLCHLNEDALAFLESDYFIETDGKKKAVAIVQSDGKCSIKELRKLSKHRGLYETLTWEDAFYLREILTQEDFCKKGLTTLIVMGELTYPKLGGFGKLPELCLPQEIGTYEFVDEDIPLPADFGLIFSFNK